MQNEILGEEAEKIAKRFPKMTFGSWVACTYCGAIPGARDHAIAASFVSPVDRHLNRDLVFQYGPQCPACGNCNAMLGDKYFDTFSQRATYVSAKLQKKAAKIPRWDQSEMRPLKYSLKQLVIKGQANKVEYTQRANWFGSREYCENLESLLYEPMLTESHPSFNKLYYGYFESTMDMVRHCLEMRGTLTN